MMRKIILTVTCCFVLITGISPMPRVNAQAIDEKIQKLTTKTGDINLYATSNSSVYYDDMNALYQLNEEGEIVPLVVGSVTLFVLGFATSLVFGWIVDAVVIYKTGYSGTEWVLRGINALDDYLHGIWGSTTKYYISTTTNKVSYAADANGCVIHQPNGVLICPWSL